MGERDHLAERFEEHRGHLRAVAYRMLGSVSEADDAVQEAWLRLSRAEADGVDNLGGWLTTVVARVCLDMLRSRKSRRESELGEHLPDPVVSLESGDDPEREALLADSIGLALLIVLEELAPAERLAFVLHDMFGVPFTRSLRSSTARPTPLASSRAAPAAACAVWPCRTPTPGASVSSRTRSSLPRATATSTRCSRCSTPMSSCASIADRSCPIREVRGAEAVIARATGGARLAPFARPVLVNGAPGFLVVRDGKPLALGAVTVMGGRIVEMNIIANRERLRQMDLPV